jgi:kynurenine formamidase
VLDARSRPTVGVGEGLFACLPLRITGATGSWVRPVLVV